MHSSTCYSTLDVSEYMSYSYKCGRMDCEEEYIEKSGRIFVERFKEHMEAPHLSMTITTSLVMTYLLKSFSIVGREDQNWARSIKEAIFIRVKDLSLNRNIGK